MKFILRYLLMILAIFLTAWVIPGTTVAGFWTAFWLVLFLGIINVTLKPILILLTLPINILTLGLFTFVINALIVLLAASVIKGFEIDGFLKALLFSIVLSVVSYLLNTLFSAK
jgi:putative membrane protein